ncbi:MAG: DUF1460 domain-containing protein [Xenococcaceae cyanobacterium MO_188.B29]|nr:DUF1460 domain-containing protein [Xenococcaceae cyanobacterium MO_188.B29]
MKLVLLFLLLFSNHYVLNRSTSQVETKLKSSRTFDLSNHFIILKNPLHNKLQNTIDYANISEVSPTKIAIKNSHKKLEQNADEQKIFHQIVQNSINHQLSSRSIGEIIQVIAESFLGAKYKAGLLDRYERETLVISFREFDCVLFVETVLALSRSIALQDYSYQAFEKNIIDRRYWNGNLNGYCSRLHYFSEWIFDNQRRKNLEDISISIGGTSQIKKLDFMSKHRNRYPRMSKDDTNYQCIVEMEANLANQSIPTNYIPKKKISNVYNQLKPGDIIGITTNISGLDVTHTGLVYYNSDNTVGLIHASPIGQVTIAPDLHNYVNRIQNSTGIIVARPIDPRTKKSNLVNY